MAGLQIDPSILLGGRGVSIPSPLDMSQQMIQLSTLAQAQQARAYQIEQQKRQDAAARALQMALPRLLAGESAESLAAQHPEASAEILTRDLALKRGKREDEKLLAEQRAKDTERKQKGLVDAANVANMELRREGGPDGMSLSRIRSVMKYYGLEHDLPTPPNPNDLYGVRTYLETLAASGYNVKDQEVARNTREHQDAQRTETERGRRAQLDAQREHWRVLEQQGWARINQDRFSAPVEGTVNGQPSMVVFDKQQKRFVTADEFASMAAMGSGGGGSPGGAATRPAGAAPAGGYGMGDRSGGGMPAAPQAPAAPTIGPKLPPPTEGARNDLRSIDSQISVIKEGMKIVESNPTAFSFKRGIPALIPTDALGQAAESIAGRYEKDHETQARSFLYNQVSSVIKERSGTASSGSEQRRLLTFLPGPNDEAPQIISKLKGFLLYLEATRRANPVTQDPRYNRTQPAQAAPQAAQSQPEGPTVSGPQTFDMGEGFTATKKGSR